MYEKIAKLFLTYGVKSLSMDDISAHLGISKKTLYLKAENKSDLVYKVLQHVLAVTETEVEMCSKNDKNAIENMIHIAKIVKLQTKGLKTQMIFELKKYYPEAFELIESHRETCISSHIHHNLKSGIKQNLYRKDIDIKIITLLYMNMNNIIFSEHDQNHDVSKLFTEMLKYHLLAITTEEGKEYLEKNKIFTHLENY